MSDRNKTLNIDYRFLSNEDFLIVYRTLLDAFSDYIIPAKVTEIQFENLIAQNAVDFELSVGAFNQEKMVGYTLNGFGLWNGKKMAYDAGTGVIPGFRNKGIGTGIFDFLLPKLQRIGIEQMLLEVIEDNENAIKLYEKFGFKYSRELAFYEQTENCKLSSNKSIEIREIEKPDWNFLKKFRDGNPSWQFSSDSIERKLSSKIILGAFFDGKCVGYGIVFPTSGIVAQIAVDKNYRKKGIGSAILAKAIEKTDEGNFLKFSNVDFSLKEIIGFLEKLNFKHTLTQIEMIKTL
jgi:ribosomal protein S18 acetylase RimI-like enzyme